MVQHPGKHAWPADRPGPEAFEDDRQLLVDIMDDGMGAVIGRLRVFYASEGDRRVAGGVFSFKNEGAWVVDCSEPE